MSKLRILSINKYYAMFGGADREMFSLVHILRDQGHEVAPFAVDRPETLDTPYRHFFPQATIWEEAGDMSMFRKLKAFGDIIYNRDAKRQLGEMIKEFRPDVAHVHNIHFDLSPSIFDALGEAGVPVVMHLHDSRLFCPNAYFYTQGQHCDKCLHGRYHHAVLNRCIRDDWKASLAVAVSHAFHRWRGCWEKRVDRYVSPTEVVRDLAVGAGMNADRIDVYTYPAPLKRIPVSREQGDYLLFCGIHLETKGVFTLIKAMCKLKAPVPLRICGRGPDTGRMKKMVKESGLEQVEFLGFVPDEELDKLLQGCLALVLPSLGFDNSNALVREAGSAGKPVIGARSGGIPETVIDGENGLIFDRGDAEGLAGVIERVSSDRELAARMGSTGRKIAEELCNEELYYRNIMSTYEKAIALHA